MNLVRLDLVAGRHRRGVFSVGHDMLTRCYTHYPPGGQNLDAESKSRKQDAVLERAGISFKLDGKVGWQKKNTMGYEASRKQVWELAELFPRIPIIRRRYGIINTRDACPSIFINRRQNRKGADQTIQPEGSRITGQLSSWRCGLTDPSGRCGAILIQTVTLKYDETSISPRERHRRGCAAYPLTTSRK